MKATRVQAARTRPNSSFIFGLIIVLGLGLVRPTGVDAADEARVLQTELSATQALDKKLSPAGAMPPLPFNQPQIGPLIRRGYQDDVERRTTAFIPKSLDQLTSMELPDTDQRWIRVDLSEQTVVAYEGKRPVRGFIISSGLPDTPTVTGEFRIRTKVVSQTMTGGDPAKEGDYYSLPNVRWVQYFVHEYAFHGTWWHNDFGRPKSHGCINMTNADAKWLFDWAAPAWDGTDKWFHSTKDEPGTLVIVHE